MSNNSQLQLHYTTLQLRLHNTTLHPAVVGDVKDQIATATIATSPKKTQLQPPLFGQSVDSLCHPCLTTTSLSYRFPILKLPPPPCAVLLVNHGNSHHFPGWYWQEQEKLEDKEVWTPEATVPFTSSVSWNRDWIWPGHLTFLKLPRVWCIGRPNACGVTTLTTLTTLFADKSMLR